MDCIDDLFQIRQIDSIICANEYNVVNGAQADMFSREECRIGRCSHGFKMSIKCR